MLMQRKLFIYKVRQSQPSKFDPSLYTLALDLHEAEKTRKIYVSVKVDQITGWPDRLIDEEKECL